MPARKSFGYNLLLYAASYGPVPFYLALAAGCLIFLCPELAFLSISFAAVHLIAMRHFLRWARQQEASKERQIPNLPRQNAR